MHEYNNTLEMPSSNLHFSLQVLPPIHQFPYEQEKILLSHIQSRNLPEIRNCINNLLGYTILSEKNSLIDSKSRTAEIASVFTRVMIETGSKDTLIIQLSDICHEIQCLNLTYDALCEKLQQMASFFMHCIQTTGPLSSSQMAVCQARGYIARHYASRITLQEAADYVHLNPSYFSSVFKNTYGISFKEFLNRIRIEKSRQLLSETNDEILDIAIASGFEDQSYFTKMFRKYTGQTPKQFRTSHYQPSNHF